MDLKRLGLVFTQDWRVLEEYLQEERARMCTALLNSSKHDESMALRGDIKRLDTLLRLPEKVKAARNSK